MVTRAPHRPATVSSTSTSGFEDGSDDGLSDVQTQNLEGSKAFLRREVGLLGTISLLVCSSAGSGIFVTPAIVYRNAGSAGVALVVWFVASCSAMLGGLCYAEMGTMLPISGGSYSYVAEACKSLGKPGDFVRFMYAWSFVTLADPMTATFHGLTISTYLLGIIYPACSAPYALRLTVALIFTCVASAINSFSVKISSRVQGVLSAIKCLILVTIIVTGAIFAFRVNHLYDAPMFTSDTTVASMLAAFYACDASYAGWQCINNVAGEMTNPQRNIPLALFGGLAVVTVLSLLVNVAYFVVLGPATVASSEAIAVSFATATWGTAGAILIALAVTISTFGTMTAGFFSGARAMLAMARNGHLPAIFGCINVRSSVPLTSLLLRCFLALVYAFTGSVDSLVPNMMFVFCIINALIISSFFVLRVTMKNEPRPYRVPTIFPVLWLVFLMFLSVSSIVWSVEHMQYGIMIALFVSGAIYYTLFAHFKLCLPAAEVVTCFVQKLLLCAPCFSDTEIVVKRKVNGRAKI